MELKNILILCIFVSLLVIAQFSQAQTVDDIVEKYTRAIGGKEKASAVVSVATKGITERNGNEIVIQTTRVQGKLFRNEINFGMGTMVTIVTPEKGWRSNPRNGGAMEEMNADQLKNQQSNLECISPLFDYAAKGHKAELIGKDSANGTACFKIKLTTKEGKEINFWIDAGTFLINQSSQKNTTPRGETEVISTFSDYKAVEGVLFPFASEQKIVGGQGGFGGGAIVFETIEVNKPVDPKLYKPE